MNRKIFFAGEPNAGLHSKVVEAISRVNSYKDGGYRGDEETKLMEENFNRLFGRTVKSLMFSSGSAANVTGLAMMLKPWQSVICAETGHIHTYETGALQRFAGCSIELLPTADGKISLQDVDRLLAKRPVENIYSQPKVVFVTQPTEMGILWRNDELKELGKYCHKHDIRLFVDGARLAQAADKLETDLASWTSEIGADMLTWGGIKNGGLADVLVILNENFFTEADFVFKQIGQDVAPSRTYAASVNALLENDLWVANAHQANNMAERLYTSLRDSKNVEFVLPVETNLLWSIIPEGLEEKLNDNFIYYQETNDLSLAKYRENPFFTRWVTSWATTHGEVDALVDQVNRFR